MEDYEAHEQEFWRKLGEGEMSRAKMLRRSAAAAAGTAVSATFGTASLWLGSVVPASQTTCPALFTCG